MKELYTQPELEIIRFQMNDVITTSKLDENELPMVPANPNG